MSAAEVIAGQGRMKSQPFTGAGEFFGDWAAERLQVADHSL